MIVGLGWTALMLTGFLESNGDAFKTWVMGEFPIQKLLD